MSGAGRVVLQDLLSPDQKETLEAIYLSYEVASDQLRRAPEVFAAIVDAFHVATGRTDIESGLLLRYIFNRRKQKDWPRLGSSARKFTPVTSVLTVEELAALRTIYETLDEASDNLLFSSTLMRKIATHFRVTTGRSRPGTVLVATIVAKRKRGEWVRLRNGNVAFADISLVASQHAG